ncbi:major facilitator superfamily domain-containing protein [Mycena olivaceomarginata]|nr:major facilitator superfamily domain-containing protein [Mycena olivaceomarginata]
MALSMESGTATATSPTTIGDFSPILGVLYALALIDRTNISIARVVGLDEDLGLSVGSRFSIVIGIYSSPTRYCKSLNVYNLLRYASSLGQAIEHSSQLGMGFVPNWQLLAFLRALLGILEGIQDMKFRLGWPYFMSSQSFWVALARFFAYALSLLSGKLGIAGWAWIFIIEGAITIVFGIVGWFYLPGFPDRNDFLSIEETAVVLSRVQTTEGTRCRTSLTWKKFVDAFDWRVWAYAFMFLCATISTYGVGFFVTLILRGLGWSVSASLLLSAPPFVFAVCVVFSSVPSDFEKRTQGISTVLFSRLSDHYRQRALFIAIQCATAIVGWCLTGFAPAGLWRYGGLFLSNAGSSGSVIGILAYVGLPTTSFPIPSALSFSSVIISAGGVGGLLASSIFTQASAPRYLPGIVVTVISQVLLLGVLCATTVYFRRQNAWALRESAQLEGHPGFLYTL